MRSRAEVSFDKLRGGFYTPAPLVAACLERARALLGRAARLRVLEPSAGDGAFLRALDAPGWRERVGSVLAIEPLDAPALGGLTGSVRAVSAVAWAATAHEDFDLAVGNPPFVRYQFVSAADRTAALELGERLEIRLSGVSNLWIPVLLGALSRVRAGGVFAFVVPAECFTGVSARAVRRWLLRECDELAFDHFGPEAFPGVLQEVTVLSGRRGPGCARVRVGKHVHAVADDGPWTRHLLAPGPVAAASAWPALGELAAFEVSIVTGANAFFSADAATVARFGLEPWARPLLPRIRLAPGLRYTAADATAARLAGARTALLDFAEDAPDPLQAPGAAAYLAAGEAAGLPARYKCRIRRPWFRVPGIRAGELLLSKRSHHHPRLVVNAAGALTTDTIYRGRATGAIGAEALTAGFHNSLTLLTAELEGRSFGGGVLELVPSEVARLRVPACAPLADALPGLDAVARRGTGSEALVAATDALLVRRGLVPPAVLEQARAARAALVARRMARNATRPGRLAA